MMNKLKNSSRKCLKILLEVYLNIFQLCISSFNNTKQRKILFLPYYILTKKARHEIN